MCNSPFDVLNFCADINCPRSHTFMPPNWLSPPPVTGTCVHGYLQIWVCPRFTYILTNICQTFVDIHLTKNVCLSCLAYKHFALFSYDAINMLNFISWSKCQEKLQHFLFWWKSLGHLEAYPAGAVTLDQSSDMLDYSSLCHDIERKRI